MSGEYIYEVGPSPLFLFLVGCSKLESGVRDISHSVSQADGTPTSSQMPGPRRPINSCIALDDYGSPIVHSRTTSVLDPPRALLATGGHPGRGPSLHSPLFYWDAPLRCVRLAHCALHQASPHSLARRAGRMTALLAELISVLAVMETRGGREMMERWRRGPADSDPRGIIPHPADVCLCLDEPEPARGGCRIRGLGSHSLDFIFPPWAV